MYDTGPIFPSSNHSQNGSSVVLRSFFTILVVVAVGGWGSPQEGQETNLHRTPWLPRLSNNHYCRNAASLQAMSVVTEHLALRLPPQALQPDHYTFAIIIKIKK